MFLLGSIGQLRNVNSHKNYHVRNSKESSSHTICHQSSNIMTSTTAPSKRVTFNPMVTGVEIKSVYDYTAHERSACWYNAEENGRITKRCYQIIMRIQNNGEGAKKYCTRGLEGHTKIGSVCKKKNRAISIAAVLAEQSNQWISFREPWEQRELHNNSSDPS